MSDRPEHQRKVRVRTASDRKKAMDQYYELRRTGKCETAVILCHMKDGSFQVLGQGLSLDQISEAVLLAIQAVTSAHDEINAPRLEPHVEPTRRGIWNHGKPRAKKITLDATGELVPPEGENFISCGECAHPKWFILHSNASDMPSRYACAHCGNEIEMVAMDHEAGRA